MEKNTEFIKEMRSRRIRIFDTTLRDGEQSPGASMSLEQKLRMAQVLEGLCVDRLEAGFPISSPVQYKAVETIAGQMERCSVAALARCLQGDIDAAWGALKKAQKPLLHLFIATSPLHREHKLKLQPRQVLKRMAEMLDYARQYFEWIEFSPEDASRTEPEFLVEVVGTALAHGAKIVNIPDTVGYAVPEEMASLVRFLLGQLPELSTRELSVHCHNDLGLAVANSLAAVNAGAGQVEVTLSGIGERAGNCSLEELVMALKVRKGSLGIETGIDTTKLYPASRILQSITGWMIPRNKPIFGENAFNHESGIHQHGVLAHRETYEIIKPAEIGRAEESLVLGRHSGRHAFRNRLDEYGIRLDESSFEEVFARFTRLADQKREMGDDDLLALVSDVLELPSQGHRLDYYHVVTGNALIPGATVRLMSDKGILTSSADGDGPVDALFRSIDNALGMETVLEEYMVSAIGSGKEAQGRVRVSLRIGKERVEGLACSTDILKASAMAYLNAVNRHLRRSQETSKENNRVADHV